MKEVDQQTMQFYLNAVMKQKTQEGKYSVFLFIIGEKGKESSTRTWEKLDENNQPTNQPKAIIAVHLETKSVELNIKQN